ncbi:hypothetical protein SAMN04515667_0968 [Formosa sp. Hel1_31_208]|nr:hypothetical protein SAMN04515667_0968 [Formosa sp. Hel1_31_208]
MIKFFRNIRQNLIMENKTGKYLKYAVGEIVLVVIGILIALSINNWNENRLELNRESKLLKTLLKDLYIAETESVESINKDKEDVNSFTYMLSGKDARETLINHPKIDSIFSKTIWGTVTTNIPIINSYNDIKSAGQIRLISNENIRSHFTALQTRLNRLERILQDRLSVQLMNIDKFVLTEMNFIGLLKGDSTNYNIDYGINNEYSTLFENQFVLNVIGVKLQLTESVITNRSLVLEEIRVLINLIENHLNKNKKG